MVVFGLDISHHQGGNPDPDKCVAEGIKFIFLKATESSGFVDSRFASNTAKWKGKAIVCAYHYQRGNVSARSQAEHIMRVVPKWMPVVPDIEDNGGGLDITREIIRILRENGWKVPLVYLPGWYWEKIGKPSLRDLPPNWKSRYPDNVVGSIGSEFAMVPSSYWNPIGSNAAGWLETKILQFSSSGKVAGYSPLDLNAFRGTYGELVELLTGGSFSVPEPEKKEEEDMSFTVEFDTPKDRPLTRFVPVEVNKNGQPAMWKEAWVRVGCAYGKAYVELHCTHDGVDSDGNPNGTYEKTLMAGSLYGNAPKTFKLPDYCTGVSFYYQMLELHHSDAPMSLGATFYGNKELAG